MGTQQEEHLAGDSLSLRGLWDTDTETSNRQLDMRLCSSGDTKATSEPMKTLVKIFLLTKTKCSSSSRNKE